MQIWKNHGEGFNLTPHPLNLFKVKLIKQAKVKLIRQAVPYRGTNIRNFFCPVLVMRKGFLSLEKPFQVPILQCGENSNISFR